MKKYFLFTASLLSFLITTTKTNATQWTQLNGPEGVYVQPMAVSNGYIYFSAEVNQAFGGIYRSNNNGASWTDISTTLPVPRASSIAATGDTVYITCDTSIYMSTDNGTTWSNIKSNLPVYNLPWKVFLHNGILFCVVYYGSGSEEIFYSTNNGASWTTTGFVVPFTANFNSFTSDGNKLYAATQGYGIQVSTDNGITWTGMSNNIPFSAGIYSIVAHGDTLYAGTSNGMYISTDGANLWMPATNGLPPGNPVVFGMVINGNTVYAGTLDDGVYSTTLGSSIWSAANTGMVNYNLVFALCVNGNSLIAGCSSGVYISSISSINWTLHNTGLNHAYISALFVDGQRIFANVNSYVGLYLSNDGGNTWNPTNLTLTNYAYKISKYDNTYFAVTALGLYTSPDGSTWTSANSTLPFGVSPSVISSNANKLLLGTNNGVYYSTDGGASWTASSTGLPPNCTVATFAINGATIYILANNNIYMSTDGGLSWNKISAGLPAGSYIDLAYINGYIITNNFNGLFRSFDNGVSWQAIPLTNSYSDLVVKNNLLIATNYLGINISHDNGTNWYPWNEGLNPYITQITHIKADGNDLYCGTVLHSVWKRSLTTELTTSSVTGSPYCSGDNIIINFTSTATYNANNKFYVLLSDSSGNFANGIIIDSLASATPANITATIPDTIATGTHYRIRVFSTSPYVINTDNGNDISINQKPKIILQPANQTTCEGFGSGFYCGASGSGITYQWQVDNGTGYTNLSNNATYQNVNNELLLILSATAPMNNYKYRCIVSGTCTPAVTSNFGLLTVTSPAPNVTLQPLDTTVCPLTPIQFTINATGGSLSYKWELNSGSGSFFPLSNGGIYSGVTTATLDLSSVTAPMDGYQYRCLVGDCEVSNPATLTVNGEPIASNVSDANICAGYAAHFIANTPGANITYQWEEDNGSGFTIINNGGNYSGANTSMLTVNNVTAGMNGYLYRCNLTGLCSPFTSQTNSAVLNLNFSSPVITQQPNNISVCENSNAQFGIEFSPFTYTNWQINDGSGWIDLLELPPFSGVNTDTLSIDTVNLSFNNYKFRCRISDCTLSDSVTLIVNAFPVVSLSPFANACINTPPITLNTGTPAGGTYFGQGIFNNQFTPAAVGAGTYTISYLYSSPNGCSSIASQNIIVNPCVNAVVNNYDVEEYLTVYPNPANDYFNIDASGHKINSVELFSLIGEKVFSKTVNANSTQIAIKNLNDGIYILRCITDTGILNRKVQFVRN